MRRKRQSATSRKTLRPRQPRFESLDARDLLAADLSALAEVAPAVAEFVDGALMGDLQRWARETGVDSQSLFSIRALHHPLDVSLDGAISPVDLLVTVNQLNAHGARSTLDSPWEESGRFDVNSDGVLSPVDLLHLLEGLNDRSDQPSQWWREADSPNQLAADLLDLVHDDLAGRSIDETVTHVDDLEELLLDHVEYVQLAVAQHLHGDPHGSNTETGGTRFGEVSDLVEQHLTYLGELLDRHIADLPGTEPITGSPGEGESNAGGDVVQWHVDYLGDLIASHIHYVRAGVSLDEIDELIGTHVDYLSHLLEIHDVDVNDDSLFERAAEELSQGFEWLQGLGLHASERLGLPAHLADAWDSAWRHVAYAGDLIEAHDGVFDEDIDWASTIATHVGYVKDLLHLHIRHG